ncbi:MAG: hypothetical protein IIV19_04730 [Bacteroidaceae bacterium]|nr:hypothetical protein [Bacteroidaceae bacterium]
MKKSFFLIVLLFLGVTIYAQDNGARRQGNAQRPNRTMRRSFSPEEMAKAEVDAINAAVGLDSLQYQLVYIMKYSDMVAMQDSMKARAARAPKMGERGNNPPRLDDKQREEWMKAREDVMKKRREAMNEQMKQILSAKQYKKYLKYEEEKYSRRREFGERRGRSGNNKSKKSK